MFPVHLSILATILLRIPISLAQSAQHPKNKWVIENLSIDVENKTVVRLNTGFDLYRTNYESCGYDNTNLWKDIPCGYLKVNFPVRCGYPTEEDVAKNGNAFKRKWASCDTYPNGIEGERDVNEAAKPWLRWRVWGLEEYEEKDRALGPMGMLFRSAQYQVVHGIPQKMNTSSQDSSSAAQMVKTFSATFSLDGNSTGCAGDLRKGDNAYYCDARGRPEPGAKIVCDGPGALVGIMKCRFSADVVEETISANVFKERYT